MDSVQKEEKLGRVAVTGSLLAAIEGGGYSARLEGRPTSPPAGQPTKRPTSRPGR